MLYMQTSQRSGIRLFLDDIRDPKQPHAWDVVRSFDHAVGFVKTFGMPDHISFDHDLGEASEKTGYDFAKWLVEYDMDNDLIQPNFTYAVHSANPPGAANIRALLRNYLDMKFNDV